MRQPNEVKVGDYTLEEILERHKHWLNKDIEGWQGMRANLTRTDLSEVNLQGADLRYINFYSANLQYSDLQDAKLFCAYLHYSNLVSASLCFADLRSTYLRYANLSFADLSYANLQDADLRYANLNSADLVCADLRNTDLRNTHLGDANLCSTDLCSTILRYCDITGAKIDENAKISVPMACPSEGSFIGWKKIIDHVTGRPVIVKLQIPASAKRSSSTSNKCRCSKAKVIKILNIDGTKSELTEVINVSYAECKYEVGKMVYPDSFDENRWNECSNGIHFFVDREEALKY